MTEYSNFYINIPSSRENSHSLKLKNLNTLNLGHCTFLVLEYYAIYEITISNHDIR